MNYTRLPTDSATHDELKEALLQSEDTTPDSQRSIPHNKTWWALCNGNWIFYAALLAVVAIIFNLSLLSAEVYRARAEVPIPTRRPSTYIGFDQIARNSSSPKWPLKRRGFPEYFGVLNSKRPYLKSENTRNILLDSSHTLLMQFFIHDYGMEHCALASYFPDSTVLGSKSVNRGGASDHQDAIQVWLLENPKEAWSFLKPRSFSWSTKPPRKGLLGTLDTSLPNDTTTSFGCQSGSTLFIELSCRRPDCQLEFSQERKGRRLGFWLVQSESESVTA